MKGLIKVRDIWFIEVVVQGQRLRKSTKTDDYNKACLILAEEKAKFTKKVSKEITPCKPIHPVITKRKHRAMRKARPFSVAAAQTAKSLWAENATLRESLMKVELLTAILGDPDIKDIDVEMLEDLKDILRSGVGSRKHGERAPRTVNKYLSTVTTILKHEVRLGNLQNYPTAMKFSVKSNKRILTQEEIDSLISYCERRDPDFADAVKVLLDTGMRTGELSQLYAFHVDFRLNTITLNRMKTKSGKDRTITMTDRVREIMQRRITSPMGKVFPYNQTDNYKHRWQHWRRTQPGGMEDKALTPHALRHTCCTKLLAATNNIYVVKQWMGHSQITTTEEYLSLLPGQLQEAAEKLQAYNQGAALFSATKKNG